MTSRPTTAAPILAALALLLIPLALYIGGYYGLCEYSEHLTVTGGVPMNPRASPTWAAPGNEHLAATVGGTYEHSRVRRSMAVRSIYAGCLD